MTDPRPLTNLQTVRIEIGAQGFHAYLNDELVADSSSISTLEKVFRDAVRLATGRPVLVMICDPEAGAQGHS